MWVLQPSLIRLLVVRRCSAQYCFLLKWRLHLPQLVFPCYCFLSSRYFRPPCFMSSCWFFSASFVVWAWLSLISRNMQFVFWSTFFPSLLLSQWRKQFHSKHLIFLVHYRTHLYQGSCERLLLLRLLHNNEHRLCYTGTMSSSSLASTWYSE